MTLSAMDATGPAVAWAGEQRLLVPGGIPGERVRLRLVRALGRSLLAEIAAIEEASAARVTPRCRHAAECGGCGWQHIAYAEQLRLKSQMLAALLRREMGAGAPAVEPALGMPAGADGMPWGFRQKAAFVFGPAAGGERLAMGHFARGTNRVVAVAECPVHDPRANRIAFTLRDALARAGVRAAGDRGGGLARHAMVRTSADGREAVALLVATRDDPALRRPLRELASGREAPEGVLLNLNDRPGPHLLGSVSIRVHGHGHVREDRLGPSFLVSPTGFFQTNVEAARILLQLVAAALPARGKLRILDLYSGSGLFAVPLARLGHAVTAVEESRKATRDAARNARINGVPESQLRLVCSKVEAALPHLARERFDVVVVDPPRQGCPPQVVRALVERLRPKRAIFVSCNPEALAREVALAMAAGYAARAVQPVDMFPHTPHVEAVAVLDAIPRRREAPGRGGSPAPPTFPAGRPRSRPRSPGRAARPSPPAVATGRKPGGRR